jgi:hypothetical protein
MTVSVLENSFLLDKKTENAKSEQVRGIWLGVDHVPGFKSIQNPSDTSEEFAIILV